MKHRILNLFKSLVFKKNKIYPVLRGPLKGMKIRVTDNSQYAPVVGNWEPQSQHIFSNLIKPGQIIFDLGANIGIHTLLFARLTGPSGKVIAFEPLSENANELRDNVKINNLEQVTIEEVAVSDKDGISEFFIGQHNTQGSIVSTENGAGQKVEVKTQKLDNYIKASGHLPDFIKIDVEGAETNVLKGYTEFISKSYPVFFIESHSRENEDYIYSFLASHGYTCMIQHDGRHSDFPGIKFLMHPCQNGRLFTNERGTGTVIALHNQ